MKLHTISFKKQIPYYLLVLFIVLIALIVIPAGHDIIALRNDIQIEREKLEESYAKGLSLRKTKEQLANIQQDVNQINRSILKPGQELFLITALEDIANRKNLEQNISMDDLPSGITKMTALPLQVKLTGRFSDILFYVAEVEQLDFYVNWSSITFKTRDSRRSTVPTSSRAPEDGTPEEENIISVILEGETYWKP